MGDLNHEPSMEEILASIKRIIAEDGEGPPAGARRAKGKAAPSAEQAGSGDQAEEEVLELTHRLDPPADEMPPSDVRGEAAPDPEPPVTKTGAAPADPEPVAVPVAAAEAPPATEAAPPAVAAPAPTAAAGPAPVASSAEPRTTEEAPLAAAITEEPLLSPAARQASRQAIAALSTLVVRADPPGSDTLEGIVRDMLRPMLKDWLDARLPALVEQVVAREIARIVEERG